MIGSSISLFLHAIVALPVVACEAPVAAAVFLTACGARA